MGEAKRREQAAAASITEEQRRTAAQMEVLVAAGLDEVEILAAMKDSMSYFHDLLRETALSG